MKELIATIHFIGLALFSSQVPNEDGLRVLLPRIEHRERAVTTTTLTGQVVTRDPLTLTGTSAIRAVESHNAYIIFEEDDLLQEIGWKSEAVPAHMVKESDPPVRYRLVRLNGERVTFLANGVNPPAAAAPAELPKPKCGTAVSRVSLRTVTAMISIPEGYLNTCAVQFEVPAETRVDTELKLNNQGLLTVWATVFSETRALILKGDARVFVANVPHGMIFDPDYARHGASHYHAYYDLLKTSGRCPNGHGLEHAPVNIRGCPLTSFRLAGDVRGFKNNLNEAINSDCSNSSWP
ncbi:MAG TPA: hypothetical protein VF883_23465 [Thermoanaerobaculia bacterium]|jgi:hypothetical protein